MNIFSFGMKCATTSIGMIFAVPISDSVSELSTIQGSKITSFAARVYDTRVHGRRLLRLCNRRGKPCYYYSAYYVSPDRKDPYTGTINLSGTLVERELSSGRIDSESNPRVGYMPPVFMKILEPTYNTQRITDEKGESAVEEAMVTFPPVFLPRRWDRFKIGVFNHIVVEEPKVMYDNKGFVLGYLLRVRSLTPALIEY
jgi:hypothetical protein